MVVVVCVPVCDWGRGGIPAQEITVSGNGVTRQLHGLLRNQAALDLEH